MIRAERDMVEIKLMYVFVEADLDDYYGVRSPLSRKLPCELCLYGEGFSGRWTVFFFFFFLFIWNPTAEKSLTTEAQRFSAQEDPHRLHHFLLQLILMGYKLHPIP